MNRKPFLDEFFKRLDKMTQAVIDHPNRALYLLLDSNRDALPWIDLDDMTAFHKSFRQTDVLGGGKDLAVWHLLSCNDALWLIEHCAKKALDMVITDKKEQYTCPKCKQVSEDKLCMECFCAVCGEELECMWCVDCESENKESNDE